MLIKATQGNRGLIFYFYYFEKFINSIHELQLNHFSCELLIWCFFIYLRFLKSRIICHIFKKNKKNSGRKIAE